MHAIYNDLLIRNIEFNLLYNVLQLNGNNQTTLYAEIHCFDTSHIQKLLNVWKIIQQ